MPAVVGLLPARNAEHDVPGYLKSASRVCDAVVALDDGSTDSTADLLEEAPLVEILLRNPRRRTYDAWDDAANRNRLLRAAAALDPAWIVSLDADERIQADDAAALRDFLAKDALPGCAYGFQHFQMWGDGCAATLSLIYRLFAFRPGQSFPSRRLHFNPVPVDIPRSAWVPTTIRVQHFGSASESRLRERRAKYQQADPEGAYATGSGGLDAAPDKVVAWAPRPPDLPVLAATPTPETVRP
jgi:glycosyltransferase involved in cell wall biosynthesis